MSLILTILFSGLELEKVKDQLPLPCIFSDRLWLTVPRRKHSSLPHPHNPRGTGSHLLYQAGVHEGLNGWARDLAWGNWLDRVGFRKITFGDWGGGWNVKDWTGGREECEKCSQHFPQEMMGLNWSGSKRNLSHRQNDNNEGKCSLKWHLASRPNSSLNAYGNKR